MAPFLCQFPFLVILKVQTARLTEKWLTIKIFSDLALKKKLPTKKEPVSQIFKFKHLTFFKCNMYIHYYKIKMHLGEREREIEELFLSSFNSV